jgi:hypothetical protein
MEAIFFFKVSDSVNMSDRIRSLIIQDDFYKFLSENINSELRVSMIKSNKISEKQQMFDYYHKVVLGVAIQVFSADGWEGMDKVKADHFLKQECAKGLVYNYKLDREEIYFEEKSKMNNKRLHKYITDCIIFLEVEKGARVPDSDSYKLEQQTGIKGFKNVK